MYDIPILSIKDKVSDVEWQTRVELAAAYRLFVMWLGRSHSYTYIPLPEQKIC